MTKDAETLLENLQEQTRNQFELMTLCEGIAANEANTERARWVAVEVFQHLNNQLKEFGRMQSV